MNTPKNFTIGFKENYYFSHMRIKYRLIYSPT